MVRGSVRLAAGFWAALLGIAPVAHAGLVDQQQPGVDRQGGPYRIGGVTRQRLAQTITAGLSGRVTEVRFPVSCASGDLRVEIQGVAGGVPSGAVYASRSVHGSELSGDPFVPFDTVTFGAPPYFSGGSRYALVLSSTGICEVLAGPVGDPYRGGDGLFRDASLSSGDWAPLGDREDLPFQVVVETGGVPVFFEDQDTHAFVKVSCFLQALLL